MSGSEIEAVRRTAALARLSITAEEELSLSLQFERILESFQVLSRADVSGVAELHSPTDGICPLREDSERSGLGAEQALRNAPERVDDFFSVPKTVGEDA